MKFIHYLESIMGIGIFPLISLIIFFTFFTILLLYVIRADKQHIKDLKQIPLENNDPSTLQKKQS
ncbi:MAG: cytochrome C oxidase Cbb3 [Candidatus Fluviicola riflensis]|nr:MAG: CcoQ/FixQ family Cbb3-type cytochrome c oxidase assembly chaperone [Candidatus Fluviicola riflensis]OGS77850.1 MAG: cytochrome C oxidase Cbb3 [Candidatus Fluviicola riflensis]OGS84915.1 MAG: cytochrome C oxidase Cbb3 [Fluviicola sp. RIFCSPHIGHO2_01_FULL_43_53]OGS89187.1 MAG: cytochrome C oxidase Cbb3 [Fluviicola sp. RIFCSPHIGHO2_12_FULL_43_24]